MGWQISCSSCYSQLTTKTDINKAQGNSLPHILLCGHTVCGLCVKRGLRNVAVVCNLCGTPTPTTEFTTTKDFPLNAYLLGSSRLQNKPPTVRLIPSGAIIQESKPSQKQSKDTTCCECTGGNGPASLRCLECDRLYCKICFNKVHSFKALMSHHQQPVGMSMIKQIRCTAHEDAKEFIFCTNKDCNTYVCYLCFLTEHRDHPFAQVKQKNEEFIPQISAAIDQAQVVKQRLLRARKEAEKPAIRHRGLVSGIEDVKKAVGEFMVQIHGYLQLKENEMLAKLGKLEQNISVSLCEVYDVVEEQLKQIDRIVEAAKYTLQPECDVNVDLGDVLRNVEKLGEMPCFFLEENSSEDASVAFKEDKTILQLISKLDVEVKNGRKFCLVQEKDLPEGSTLNDTDEGASGDATAGCAIDGNADVGGAGIGNALTGGGAAGDAAACCKDKDTDESGSTSDVSSVTSLELAKGSALLSSPAGSVSHLANVVHSKKNCPPQQNRAQQQHAEKHFLLALNARSKNKKGGNQSAAPKVNARNSPSSVEFANKPTRRKVDTAVSSLVTGDSIDVKISYVNNPCNFFVQAVSSLKTLRQLNIEMSELAVSGQLMTVDDDLSGLYLAFIKDNIWSRARVLKREPNGTMVEVLCVDTGVARKIPISSLRKLPAQAACLPPFSARCKLFDFVMEGSRQNEAPEYFYKITKGKFLRMDVMNMTDGILHVDLRFKEDDKDISAGSSIRDVMVFSNFGTFLGSVKKVNGQCVLRPMSAQDAFSVGDKFNAVCTHAESPRDVYLQKLDGNDGKNFERILHSMNAHYSRPNDLDQIHCPIPGLLCAAQYTDGNWYRAEVIKLCPEQKVSVRYIDFGNYEEVHWKNLRVLYNDFRRVRIQVVSCAMNGMENAKKKEAARFIKEMMKLEPFKVEVVDKTADKLIVNLFLKIQGKWTDILDVLQIRKTNKEVDLENSESGSKAESVSSGNEDTTPVQDKTKIKELTIAKAPVQSMVKAPLQTDEKTAQKDVATAPQNAVVKVPERNVVQVPTSNRVVEVPKEPTIKILSRTPIQEDATANNVVQTKTIVSVVSTEGDVTEAPLKESAEAPLKEESAAPLKKESNEAPLKEDSVKASVEECYVIPADETVAEAGVQLTVEEKKEPEGKDSKEAVKEEGKVSKAVAPEKEPEAKKPGRMKIDLLRAESPSRIFVMFSGLRPHLEKMRENLKEYYSKDPPGEGWEPTLFEVYAFLSQDNAWYRGRVTNISPDKKTVDVFLIDWGRDEKGPLENLRVLDVKYAKINVTGSIRCSLADIAAPGGKDVWPSATKESLVDELKENANNLFISVKGEVKDYTAPIILWVKHVIEDALEPTREEWYAINKFLCDEGLALPLPGLKGEEYSYENPFEEEAWSNEMWGDIDEFSDDFAAFDEESSPEGKVGCFEPPESVLPSDHVVSSEPLESWLRPETVKGRFIGEVTYVDINCCIYLHHEKRSRKLEALSQRLSRKYNNSLAEDNVRWRAGQICIAQYHYDKKCYRATIEEVISPEEVVVVFVDYGNVERCLTSQLRANPVETAFPIQCIKCKLDGVIPVPPKTNWTETEMDYLHALIVDKRCSVFIVRGPTEDDECYMVDLTTMDGTPVCKYLLDKDYAMLSAPTHLTASSLPSPPYSDYDSDDDVVVLDDRISESIEQREVTEEATPPPPPVKSTSDLKVEADQSMVDLEVSIANATGTPSEYDLTSISIMKEDSISEVDKERIEDIINASIIMVNDSNASQDVAAIDKMPTQGESVTEANVGTRGLPDSSSPSAPTKSYEAGDVAAAALSAPGPEDAVSPSAAANNGSTINSHNKLFEIYVKLDVDNRLMKPSDFLSYPREETNPHTELLIAAAGKLAVYNADPSPQSDETLKSSNPVLSVKPVKTDWMKLLLRDRAPAPASIGRGRYLDCSKKTTD